MFTGLLLVLGCQRSDRHVVVPPPPGEGPLILLVEREGQVEQALGSSGRSIGALEPVTTKEDEPIALYALSYPRALTAYGLSDGALKISADGRALPTPIETWRADLGLSDEVEWRAESGEVQPNLRLAYDELANCPTFTTEEQLLPGAGRITGVAPAPMGGVVVAGDAGNLYAVDRRSVLPLGNAFGPISALAATDDNGIYLASDNGQLGFATLDDVTRSLRPIGAPNVPGRVVRLAADSRGEARPELFVLGESGNLERWDGAAFTLLGQYPYRDRPPTLYWLSYGQLLFADQLSVYATVDDGNGQGPVPMIVGTPAQSPITGLVIRDDTGLFAATEDGGLYRLEFNQGSWSPEAVNLTSPILGGLPYGSGVLFYDRAGALLFRLPSGRYCPPLDVGLSAPLEITSPDGVDLYLGGASDPNGPPIDRVIILVPDPTS